MRVIARSTLYRFLETLSGHKERTPVKAALDSWFHEARARWQSSQDVKRAYANASVVDAERVVFNIEGNSYRLVTTIDYRRQLVFVKWLGSHADYDRIDVRTIKYGDQTCQKRARPLKHCRRSRASGEPRQRRLAATVLKCWWRW